MSEALQSLRCTQCGASPLEDNGDGTISCPYCGSAFAHPERACPQCEAINELGALRCVSCGQVLRRPCARCGTINWIQASHCKSCGTTLDVLEHIAIRRTEDAAERLRRLQREAPALKLEAERESQARLARMWTQDRARLEALARAKAQQQRQEKILWTLASLAIIALLIAILASAVIGRFPVR